MYNVIIMENRYKRSIEKYGRPAYLQMDGEWFKGIIKQYNSKTFFEMTDKVFNPKHLEDFLNVENPFGKTIPGTVGSMSEQVFDIIIDMKIDEIL